jgi:hypothetical protein
VRVRRHSRTLLIAALSTGLGGCATHGAPSFVLFGAYFPVWMLVGLIGILAGIAARVFMVATGLAEVVPSQLLTCVSIGVTIAIAAWLIGFAG